jgi:hypothetical protein
MWRLATMVSTYDVRRKSGRGLRGRERRGSGDQLLGGGLPFEIGGGGLFLIKELTSGQDATTTDGMTTEGEEGAGNNAWVAAS